MRKAVFVFLFFGLFACGKKSSKNELAVQRSELSLPSEVEQIINSVPPPGRIEIKKLTWDDIALLNPIPPEEGGAFKAKEGDIYIETENIRAIIQSPSREICPFTYGGNLIDIDIKREDGKFHDILGEENLFVFLGHTLKPKKVGVLKDNVVVAFGELDILDFINATGLLNIIERYVPNFSLPFKIDEVKPLKAEKYFVFSNGRWIKIIDVLCNTSDSEIPYFFFADMIDSGGDGEFYIPSSVLKGYGYSAPGLPFGLGLFPAKYLSFISERLDVSYGIFPPEENNVAFIVAGVAVLAYNMLEGDPINTLVKIVRGISEKLITIQPGQCVYNEKYFIVGNASPSSLYDEFLKIKGGKNYRVSGKVVVGDGNQLPGKARVSVFDEKKNLITSTITDIWGNFSVILPEGRYTFYAEARYSQISEPVTVAVNSDTSVEISLPKPGKISVEVVEIPANKNIPAKISFLCSGECPKKICIDARECDILSSSFRDVTYDMMPKGVQEVVFSANGKPIDVYLPAGKYKVVVSRGMEYSRYEEEFELKSGESKSIKAFLYRVADTPGWISADTHVHAVNSPDSPVALVDRVITFAGEGVDVIISTDHDWLTDYEPAIKMVGIQEFLASLVGQEITTFSYGHFNAYPLKYDNRAPSAGALDWSEKYDRPEKYGIDQQDKEKFRFLRALHPREIFKNAHLMKPEAFKRNIVQMNHPRSGGMGYFDYVNVDTKTFKTTVDPCIHRIFPPLGKCGSASELGVDDTKLFIPYEVLKDLNNIERFDTIEVYNAFSEITTVINDWFSFLNKGIHITAVACSDTHKKVATISGIGRTFVWVGKGKDSPQKFREDINLQNEFIENLADGKVFLSNGIILEEFKVCSPDECIEMGFSDMKKLSPPFKVRLKVKSADWVDFDTVKIFVNARGTASRSGYKVVGYPSPISEIFVSPSTKTISIGDYKFVQKYLELEVPINPEPRDFWVVVVVECVKCEGDKNPMFPVITNKTVRPIMITNPIYVDFDGDGKFSPPEPTYSEAQAPSIRKKSLELEEAIKELMESHKH